MGDRERSDLHPPGPAHHQPQGAPGDRRQGDHLGQLEHHRELLGGDLALDLLLCLPRLQHRLQPGLGGARHPRGDHQGQRADLPQPARPGARPGLLQPRQLVPDDVSAARLQLQQGLHGPDDGGQGEGRLPEGREELLGAAKAAVRLLAALGQLPPHRQERFVVPGQLRARLRALQDLRLEGHAPRRDQGGLP
ncbi:hypothetical protein D3C86_1472750 [compost metagenome]